MSKNNKLEKLFKGFSKLSLPHRYRRLQESGLIPSQDLRYLKNGGLKSLDMAEKFIENVIGYFQLPLGVATNFCIDDRDVLIPMAVEETSIVAAASKTARWIREKGCIKTSVKGQKGTLGQIQIARVKNFEFLKKTLREHQDFWIEKTHKELIPSMCKRGGGIRKLSLRKLPSPSSAGNLPPMAVIHVLVDTCDAMGANIVNQICEYLKHFIELGSGEEVSVCIVSNLSDSRIYRSEVTLNGLDSDLMQKIESASVFAETDTYRATTSNKGLMNGMDAVLIATGNDWRAVSSGVHAYCSRKGQYQSLTRWRVNKKNQLKGVFEAPLMVGTVGGVTRLHPTARLCLNMMEVKKAEDLGRICAAVALTQNLAALRALTTVGIIEGHMKLHIKNLTLEAGARGWEIPIIQKHLELIFGFKKHIFLSQAIEALKTLREKTTNYAEALRLIRDRHQKQAMALWEGLKTQHKKWIHKL